jgi:hypothetical protein
MTKKTIVTIYEVPNDPAWQSPANIWRWRFDHPDDDAAPGKEPPDAHFTLTQDMKDEMLRRLKK